MSESEEKTTLASMVKGIGNAANEFSKWPNGLKNVALLTAATTCIYAAMHFGKKEEKYGEAKYYSVPDNNQTGGLENKLDSASGGGIIESLSNFYYTDLNNFFSLSGLLHDVGGVACAAVIGASTMRNKLPALMGAYFFTQIPELVNICNDYLSSSEIFWESGKDTMLIAGAAGLGAIVGAGGYSVNKNFNYDDIEINKKNGRPWWKK